MVAIKYIFYKKKEKKDKTRFQWFLAYVNSPLGFSFRNRGFTIQTEVSDMYFWLNTYSEGQVHDIDTKYLFYILLSSYEIEWVSEITYYGGHLGVVQSYEHISNIMKIENGWESYKTYVIDKKGASHQSAHPAYQQGRKILSTNKISHIKWIRG